MSNYFELQWRYKCRICGKIFNNLGPHSQFDKRKFETDDDLIKYLNFELNTAPIKFHQCNGQFGVCDAISLVRVDY